MINRTVLWCGSCLCLALASSVRAEGDGTRSQYLSWKSFKVGTSIRYEDNSNPQILRYKTEKLVALTDDSVTLELREGTITADGTKKEKQPETYQADANEPDGPPIINPHAVLTQGDEDILVAGRKVHAHWVKKVIKDYDPIAKDNVTINETDWKSDEVPGGEARFKDVTVHDSGNIEQFDWNVVEIDELGATTNPAPTP